MKNLFIITGASRGIGKSIACALNKHFINEDNTFLLIARSKDKLDEVKKSLKGDVLSLALDLADLDKVVAVFEEELTRLDKDFDRCVLINNAGIIKPIGFLGSLNPEEIIKNLNVNLISAMLLTNSFLKVFGRLDCKKFVINNSSGAGRMPIVCWSAYCTSKAGMDMFAKVLKEENSNVYVFSVAPGIVETDMQKDIRSTPESDFPLIEEFINFQKASVLKSPEETGEEFVKLIKHPDKFETIVSF
ncbi:benzil reductase ((S)-benzoin forming) [Thermotomaculum hydrothermale]|uniref:Benzil reductase ((S)-benzoin forming) n=1 Tax=Thermotomaculum hydrothermale TaxID=981385 RepID=A0A7R6PPG2_9BACT|nr:SDR family NAD(P)-dependent oxidoreductase [Thermotomaculum hydrothermale]BBB31961.1 benzil reductase ((S)-benzoin forming) [Thermotomaculum hydrothermale]